MFTDLKWHHELNWRPWWYTDFSDPSALILNGIRGQHRRSKARTDLERVYDGDNSLDGSTAGGEWLRESGDEDLGQTSFWEFKRNAKRTRPRSPRWRRVPRWAPCWRVGEELPKPLPGEIEIARVVISKWSYSSREYGEQNMIAVLQNILSLRARWRSGRYRYRVVDDFNRDFYIVPQTSQRTLTLSELIELLETGYAANPNFQCGAIGLVRHWWNVELTRGCWKVEEFNKDLKECTKGAKVESELYPMLPVWYDERAEEGVRETQA